jgi:hypothetical protein
MQWSHRFTSASKPAACFNLFVISETFATFLDPIATNTSHCKQEIFLMSIPCIEPFSPQKTHNRTLLLVSTLLKHCRLFDYWNQPLNMRIRVCCLDCWSAPRSFKEENWGNQLSWGLQGRLRRDGAIVELSLDWSSERAAVTRGSDRAKLKHLHC